MLIAGKLVECGITLNVHEVVWHVHQRQLLLEHR